MTQNYRLRKILLYTSKLIVIAVILLTIYAFIGIAFFYQSFATTSKLGIVINPLTAILYFIIAIIYLLQNPNNKTLVRHTIAKGLAIFVGGISITLIIRYINGFDSGLDTFFFSHLIDNKFLYRVSFPAALSIFLCSTALFYIDSQSIKKIIATQFTALIIGLIGSFLLLSYIYHSISSISIYTSSPTALLTTFLMLFMAFAIFFAHTDKGIAGQLTETTTGSRIILVFLPISTIIPVIVFWIHLNYTGADSINGIIITLIIFIVICLLFIYYNLITINRNLKERLQIEEDLKKNLKKVDNLLKLIDLSSDSVISLDKDLIITSWNKGAERIYGYTAEEAIGKGKFELLDRFTISPTEEEQRIQLQHQTGEMSIPVTRLTKSGKLVTVMVSSVVITDDEGNRIGYTGIGKDITALIEKDKELEAANQWLDERVKTKTAEITAIYERISDAVCSFDANYNFTYLNKRAESFFSNVVKYEGSLIGKNLWAEFPFLLSTETEDAYHHAMEKQDSFRIEIPYPEYNIYTEQTFYPSPQGLSVFLRNITEQKKAEEKQQEAEEMYRQIVDTAQEGMVISDENGVMIFVNDYLVKMFKLGHKKNMLGRTVLSLYNEEKQQILKTYLEERKTKKINNFEIEYTAPDNTKVMLLVNSNPLNINGKLFGTVAMISDITEKKNLEKELIRSNKLFEVLSKASNLLVNLKSGAELFEGVCNLMVVNTDIRMAWIGEHHKDTTYVETVGLAGVEGATDYIRSLSIYTNDPVSGDGPTGIAVKTGKHYICNDYFADAKTSTWHKAAKEHGIASSAVFPIYFNNVIWGAFTVYASDFNYFQDKEIALINEIVGVISVGMKKLEDEAKRQEAEIALIQAKDDWELTFNSIPDMISIIDNEHRIVRANKAMAEKLNLPLCSVEGSKCYTLMHGTNCPVEGCPHSKLLKDGQEHIANLYEKSIGAHINVTTSPMINIKDGTIMGSVHIVRDVSEQRIAELKIKQLADIIEHSSAFTGIIKMDKSLVYMNNAQRNILGVGLEEDLSTLTTTEFIIPSERERITNEVIPVLFETGIWTGESIWKSRNGNIIPLIQVMILHKTVEGEPEFISTTAIDITEIRHKEEELKKQTEELRALSNKLISIRDEERKAIAKDIHDELGQNLTVLKMDLAWLTANPTAEKEKIDERIAALNKMTTDTIATSRRLYNSLHPKMLDELGLVETIQWLIKII